MPTDHARERRERAHQRVWELLPWHQIGRLEPAEAALVEEHLTECAHCREELAHGRALARALREEVETVPSPHPGGFARLLARVDALAEARPGRALRVRAAELRRSTPRPIRRLVLGQLAAILLLALALAWRADFRSSAPGAAPGVFRTLSNPADLQSTEPALRVVFAPETPESEIRALLAETGGQIAGGPSPMGAYLIRLASPRAEPLSLVLAHLRAHPRVRFAEPVAGAAAATPRTDGGSED